MAHSTLMEQVPKTHGICGKRSWSLPVLAALTIHGAAFAFLLFASFAPRQAPIPVGESLPVTLFAAVPGIAAAASQSAAPPPQAALAQERQIQPPQPTPAPPPEVVAEPPKPVSIAPAPRHIAKANKKISKAKPQAPAHTQVAPSQGTPAPVASHATVSSGTNTASIGAQGGAANTVIPARPRYRDNPPPAYPELARRRQMEGTVVLDVLVNSTGRVDALTVHATSGHSLLDNAALRAVRNWLFVPGKRGGMPLAMSVRVPVRFNLR
nr:energy transducer TonB [uncultured Desulfobulbus sp.]